MNNNITKLINIARGELGYLEKKSGANLDSKTANAGKNNYTKYARDLYPALQAQPWCDMFVDWCFVKAFGAEKGKQLIGGGFSAYTPTSANYYKAKKQYFKSPAVGDQIFFRNSIRINHTGLVIAVSGGIVTTIEGNTSNSAAVVPNGGGVFQKTYSINHSAIDGYGRPDWSILDAPQYNVGWNLDHNGWWYANTADTYLKDAWATINGSKYRFNSDGYALRGWQLVDGKWYYFEPVSGHRKECALYVSDQNGVQAVGEF